MWKVKESTENRHGKPHAARLQAAHHHHVVLREEQVYRDESDLTMEERRDQIAALRSDMSSFKVTNPAAGLPDFIRWFSPINWDGGSLSVRTSAKANKWAVLWRESHVVPTNRQEPLFNESAYATKAISDL